jgi:putative membrane-associated phosphoesterase
VETCEVIFLVIALVTAIACSIITVRTLVSYSDLRRGTKILIALFVVLGWFAPLIIGGLGQLKFISDTVFAVISFCGFTLFGFVFLLLFMLIVRDIIWYALYGITKIIGCGSWTFNPKNISVLARANMITVLATFLLCIYSIYEGVRSPAVNTLNIKTPLVNRELTIVQLSDLHINRTTPMSRVYNVINKVNGLNPDIIFLTGDIMDDRVDKIDRQLNALGMLSAPYGIYSVMGNHEYYSGLTGWAYKFRQLGFKMLVNRGLMIGNTNVFVSGIPDAGTSVAHPTFSINFERALKGSSRNNFRVLLSHNPSLIDNLTSFNYELMLSGHTHGGQIFPFHWLAKKANTYLSGHYKVNGIDLYVSNGAGTWGPSMRLLAPSEITLIKLQPEK